MNDTERRRISLDAAGSRSLEQPRLVLEAGADTTIVSKHGVTALSVAHEHGAARTVDRLCAF